MALLDAFRTFRDTALANRPAGTPENQLVSAAVMRDTFEALCDVLETVLANPTWAVNGLALSTELIVVTLDGQTTIANALPVGMTPVLVSRATTGILKKNLEYTYDVNTRVFSIVTADPPLVKEEIFFALCQSAAVVQAAAAPAPPVVVGAQVFVADVAAIVNPATPSNTFTYTPVDTNNERTRLEKVDGQVYEAGQLILYVP